MKLGLRMQFIKALPTEGNCSKCLILAFSNMSIKKKQVNVFNGPVIQQLIKDEHFIRIMLQLKKNAWFSFKDLVKNFLGNWQAKNYTKIVLKVLENYKTFCCNRSIQLHFLHHHLSNFS